MAYSKFLVIAGGDLDVCSEPSVVPGTEWMLRSLLRKEELEIMVEVSLRREDIERGEAGDQKKKKKKSYGKKRSK